MNLKKMITLIELLALTGVSSVGFSTWVIVETIFPEAHIQVETENVFNTNVIIQNVSFSDYNSNGFYNNFIYEDDTSSNLTGYLEFDIVVDLSMCLFISGPIKFELSFETNASNSYDIIKEANNSIIRESTTYSINSSTPINGTIKRTTLSKTEYPVVVAGATVTKYKLDDTFSIDTSNRTNTLIVHLKYGFTLTSLSNLIKKNEELNQGIVFNIKSILKGEN